MIIYTIGHSNRRIEEFLALLKKNDIGCLVDIRAFPVSRRNPHFSKNDLQKSLNENGIEYLWFGQELGGYRNKSEGLGEKSPNQGWKTGGFRIYADYMLSCEFETAVNRLVEIAKEKKLVTMCAEKFYWRCHRRLISDYLLTRDHEVWHIIDFYALRKHVLTRFACAVKGVLTYPSQETSSTPSLPWL